MKTFLIAAVALTLAGCGGGGGGSTPPVGPRSNDLVRIEQTRSDLPTAARVHDYLSIHGSGEPFEGFDGTYTVPSGLRRFAAPPIVRLRAGMSDRETANAHYAVALINRVLPYDQHLRIGPDFSNDYPREPGTYFRAAPAGELFIEFTEGLRNFDGAPAFANPDGTAQSRTAAQVGLNAEEFRSRPDHQAVSVLVHELLHTLGLEAHVPGNTFPDSNMYNAWFRLDGSLPAIDASALQVLYLRLGAFTSPEDLSPTMLGAWEDESTDFTGALGPVTFGVRHGNDVSVPFSAGPEPSTRLVESRLSGMVTWRGQLLGFTPDLRTVVGDAAVGVDLGTMQGTAKFTKLKSFPVLAAPIPQGGTVWGDGTLDYEIRVGGNYLYSTGRDDGVVSGSFYGDNHGHVGGTVERLDLTAAFGGAR